MKEILSQRYINPVSSQLIWASFPVDAWIPFVRNRGGCVRCRSFFRDRTVFVRTVFVGTVFLYLWGQDCINDRTICNDRAVFVGTGLYLWGQVCGCGARAVFVGTGQWL